MFDFGVFDGSDGWKRFKDLKDAMHIKAVDEYFESLGIDMTSIRPMKIKYGIELKDGTFLTREDVKSWTERFGVEITEKKRSTIDDHFEKMVEEICAK